MTTKYERLFSTIKIGPLELRNRVMKTPAVSGLATEDGWVTEGTKERYRREAMGGLGAIALEPVVIQPSKSTGNIRLSDDRFIPGVKEVVKIMREQDRDLKIGVQFVYFPKVARSGWRQKVEDLTRDGGERFSNSRDRLEDITVSSGQPEYPKGFTGGGERGSLS